MLLITYARSRAASEISIFESASEKHDLAVGYQLSGLTSSSFFLFYSYIRLCIEYASTISCAYNIDAVNRIFMLIFFMIFFQAGRGILSQKIEI